MASDPDNIRIRDLFTKLCSARLPPVHHTILWFVHALVKPMKVWKLCMHTTTAAVTV